VSKFPEQLAYLAEPSAYMDRVRAATHIDSLRAAVRPWRELFPDAALTVARLTSADWEDWRWLVDHSAKEYRQKAIRERVEALTIKWGAILLPENLILAGLVAQKFGAPWGCALIRMAETGTLRKPSQHVTTGSEQHEESKCGNTMTRKQREVLRAIATAPHGTSVADIARKMGISRPSAYQRVWRLQSEGYVARRPGTVCSLRLTEQGREAVWPWLLAQGPGGIFVLEP